MHLMGDGLAGVSSKQNHTMKTSSVEEICLDNNYYSNIDSDNIVDNEKTLIFTGHLTCQCSA